MTGILTTTSVVSVRLYGWINKEALTETLHGPVSRDIKAGANEKT